MGNFLGDNFSENTEDKIYDIKKIYWDADGNLRHGNSERNRDDELIQLLQADTNDETDVEKVWVIIPSRWIRNWLLFAHFKLSDSPGKIDMWSLLKKDETVEGGWRPKKNLKAPIIEEGANGEEHPGHYRRISKEAWLKFVDLYGVNGYAIAVRGIPYDDVSRWRVFKDVRQIIVEHLPPPVMPVAEEGKDKDGKKENSKKGFSLFR